MKKIIVLSDTHGNSGTLKQVSALFDECDHVIHLGDGVADLSPYKLGDKLIAVKGNCDFLSSFPPQTIVEIENVKIFITHGHQYNVKKTLINVGFEGLSFDCNLVLYGHTHNADISSFENVTLFNPGSLKNPVKSLPSYGYLLISGNKFFPKIVEIT